MTDLLITKQSDGNITVEITTVDNFGEYYEEIATFDCEMDLVLFLECLENYSLTVVEE